MSQIATSLDETPSVNAPALLQAMQCLDGRPRLLLDRAGRLVWAPDEAIAELDRQDEVCLEGGKIKATRSCRDSTMRRLLAVTEDQSQIADLTGAGKSSYVIIHATAVGRDYVCWVMSRNKSWQFPDLQDCFGLTQCEANVVQELHAGKTAQDIAAGNHTSIHTVRAHIKNIYRKLAVNCREELLAKLNCYLP